MEIRGITVAEFEAVVSDVSTSVYSGNVVCEWRKRWVGSPTMLNARGDAFRGRIVVLDSSGAGARRSRSGRRMPAACWHVFRDVVRATFTVAPGARFRTSMARYDAATFESTYPATGDVNIGSAIEWVTMPELCECIDMDDYAPADAPGNGYSDSGKALAAVLPGLESDVPYPCGGMDDCDLAVTVKTATVQSVTIHLNDTHKWTRPRIADWLDALDVDLRFPTLGA